MPTKLETLKLAIAEEIAKLEARKRLTETPQIEIPQPEIPTWEQTPETFEREFKVRPWMPAKAITPLPPVAPLPPAAPLVPKEEKPVEVPFWQRALQVFTAPFDWVDENIIKPGLALAGTTVGFVPEVERLPGEDFFEWKKRSWEGWEAPGFDINVPWSDEPWRIDLKGVMEIAPWLLIPVAGQVGGGVRAAVGIAGFLGKAGKAGRVLGTVVEYSPWGLVEKTAGVAIKGGFRAVGSVSSKVSTAVGEKLYGKYVPPPVSPAVAKLTQYIKEAVVPARKAFKKEIPKLRARQETQLREVHAKYLRGEVGLEDLNIAEAIAKKGAVKPEFALTAEALAARQAKAIAEVESRISSGELTEAGGKALITKLKKAPAFTAVSFKASEVKELNDMIISGVESGLVKAESGEALRNFFLVGDLPMPYNLRDWAKVFGNDFAKAVGQLRTPQAASQLVDALNLPRSLLASSDLSATFRQGLILGLLHPTRAPVWFGRQIKAFLSEKLSLEMDDALKMRPLFKQAVTDGVYFAPMKGAVPTKAEESFMSDLARRIPVVRRSERAFITYLNEARMTAYEAAHGAMTAQGATPEMFKLLSGFINMASGRGTLPKALEKYNPVLNTVLFSPKLQAATLQLPRQIGRMLLSKNPYMRKEAAKALITFVGGGSAVLGLIKAMGGKVELDPRSGDFGKIVVGETRLDIWRGYVQYARFAAQMLSGERKSAYGNMNKAERGEIASRFLQSKSSPVFGLMVDLLRGETYQGEPIFKDTTGFLSAVKERVLPLAVQDVIDAMEQNGVNSLWVAAPATLGVGALTYVNNYVRVKEKIAKEMGFKSWDDIDPKTQREIQNRNAELQAAAIEFDRQIMGTAWGDWSLAGNAVEDVFRGNVDLAVAQFRETKDGYQFREKVRDAFTARRGAYAVRDKEPRFEDIIKRLKTKDTAEALVGLGPEQMAIRIYNNALWGDDMYDEFGDYRFDEAEIRKKLLQTQLGNEFFKYVEEYQGLKYENFPPEFQELVKAKIAMRPYWQVQSDVEKMFGKPTSESQQRRLNAVIGRIRKRLRMTNPAIAQAYEEFYSR